MVPRTHCTTEVSDEAPGNTLSYIRGESSQGGRSAGVESRSKGRNGKREANSLGSDRVGWGRSLGGLIRDSGSTLADAWGVKLRTFGGPDGLARKTESTSALVRRDGCHGLYAHSAPLSPLTHVVQGRLASHFWWGEVNLPVSQTGDKPPLTAFLCLITREKRFFSVL